MRTVFAWAVITCLFCFQAFARPNHSWTQWRGPNQDNVSPETGLLKVWPEGGPELLWTSEDIGLGHSSVVMEHGRIYTTGILAESGPHVFCLDSSGKVIWKRAVGKAWRAGKPEWQKPFYGTRSTPTLVEEHLYHLADNGLLVCLFAKTGDPVWDVDLKKRFQVKRPPSFGYSESPVTDAQTVIVSPGGHGGQVVALSRLSGETSWVCTNLAEQAGNTTGIIVEDKGVRQFITMTGQHVIGVDAASGELLWKWKHVNKFKENCTTPVYADGVVVASSGYGLYSEAIRLTYTGDGITPRRLWKDHKMDSLHAGVVLFDGHVISCGDRAKKPWCCIDVATGEVTWADNSIKNGSPLIAGGMLYILDYDGNMRLYRLSTEVFEQVSSFRIAKNGPGRFWARPVVCGGRLYVRQGTRLHCYDIAERK